MAHSYTVADALEPLLKDRGVADFQNLWKWSRSWPPDAFAIAYLLLTHHAMYRAAVSTEEIPAFKAKIASAHAMGHLWPNQSQFVQYARMIGEKWREYADEFLQNPTLGTISVELNTFFDIAPFAHLGDASSDYFQDA